MTTETQSLVDFIVPSSPADKQKIKNAVQEAIDSLTRIEGEKDNIKAIEERMKEELNIPKKLFKEWVKTHYLRALELKRQQFELFEETYVAIFGDGSSSEDETEEDGNDE